MKLKIDFNKITDAPYRKDLSAFFNFTTLEVEALVNLISKMNESSYYLSGFRGVGKTSFMMKVQEELSKINGFIFIHVPISKFDKYEILIRNFVRRFYNQFVKNESIQSQKEIKENPKTKELVESLTKLNTQTFATVNNEELTVNRFEKNKTKILSDHKAELLLTLAILASVTMATVNFESDTYKITATFMPICWAIAQAVYLGVKRTKQKNHSKQNSESQKDLYDDEIVEHKFVTLLEEFKSGGIKPIFILDELDKLDIKDAKKVLFLFKSTMLSGHANFIVIGGQDLFYELYAAKETEDPILSTLFSKTIHVPLKSSSELRNLFEKFILNQEDIKTDDQKIAFDQYLNGLIIQSRRIPRKFINLIKGELFFENGNAYINIPDEYNRPGNTELLAAIDRVCERITNHPQPVKDYIALNLFQHTDDLLNISSEEELDLFVNRFK
jgi:Cdc6-like AAA superfamily ATPase